MDPEITEKGEVKGGGLYPKTESTERGAGLLEYSLLAAIVIAIGVAARITISSHSSKAYSAFNSDVEAFLN